MSKLIQKYFFLLIILLVSGAFLGLMSEFGQTILWAIILAILFSGRFTQFNKRLQNKRGLASALTIVYMIIVLVTPLSLVSIAVINEAEVITENINKEKALIQNQVQNLQKQNTTGSKVISFLGISSGQFKSKISDFYSNATSYVANYAIDFTQKVFRILFHLLLMLYLLFFFLRDGKIIVERIMKATPLSDKWEHELLARFESVSRATVKGSLVVALAQGIIGGGVFWMLGIHAPFLWGCLIVITSLLPIGSALVWGPWSIALMIHGDIAQGMTLLGVGTLMVLFIDNYLRPRLVGKDAKMPDYLILLSTLGGLTWFGLSGFVIGPVITALFISCWQMIEEEYSAA